MVFRQSLFWDANPANIDPQKNAQYIIERILNYGDDDEMRWLWNYYDKSLIKQVVKNSRCLRPDTKKFWGLMVNQEASKSST